MYIHVKRGDFSFASKWWTCLVGEQRNYVCFVAKLKKKAKRQKKQNKREQKQKTNVSRVGRDFFVICNWDSGQILTLQNLDYCMHPSTSVCSIAIIYFYKFSLFLLNIKCSVEKVFLTNYYPPFGVSCQSSQISVNETSD